MKNKFKTIIISIFIGAVATTASSFATTGTMQKLLEYNNIKITLNNQEIVPTDANGNYVEPFIIEGTTYLPVRAIANALGLNVNWDSNANTVSLSNAPSSAQPNDTVLYNKNRIKITYNGIAKDDSKTIFKFLIENNSNVGIGVQVRDESINGFMVTGIMSEHVQPGKKANGELTYYNSLLEKEGIYNVQNLEFSFHIFNDETWKAIDDSEIIKITP